MRGNTSRPGWCFADVDLQPAHAARVPRRYSQGLRGPADISAVPLRSNLFDRGEQFFHSANFC